MASLILQIVLDSVVVLKVGASGHGEWDDGGAVASAALHPGRGVEGCLPQRRYLLRMGQWRRNAIHRL